MQAAGANSAFDFVGTAAGDKAVKMIADKLPGADHAFKGLDSFKKAHAAAKSGETGHAKAHALAGGLRTIATYATIATVADCWNPTGLAPATVALLAGGAAVAINAGIKIHKGWQAAKGWFGEKFASLRGEKPVPQKPQKENMAALKAETAKAAPQQQAKAQQQNPAPSPSNRRSLRPFR